ncbi:MucBP domain-containing protein [Levilactobacillus yonginensis]|uniref:MucBP domain-containing protein n=1 Tax=Levilactobacillus yonginensis TaxID=1054041 RepID=UPI00345C89C6
MRNQTVLGETKEHYKSYKAGKHWVYCCMTVLGLGLGVAGVSVSAQADTDTGDAAPVAKVSEPAATSDGSVQGEQPNDSEGPAKQQEQSAGQGNDGASNEKDKQSLGEQSGQKDVQEPVDQSQENQSNGQKVAPKQEAPKRQVAEESVQPETDVKQDNQVTSDVKTIQAPVASRADLLRGNAVVAPTLPTDVSKIQGVNASVWMPDPALRHALEACFEQQWGSQYKVEDWSLYAWTGFRVGLNDILTNSTDKKEQIKDLTGLQYFTGLTSVDLENADVDPATIPNFSFAPNLAGFTLVYPDDAPANWNITPDQFIQSRFDKNPNLGFLSLDGAGLVGQLPDLHNNLNIQNLNLWNNKLTGDIPDYSYLPKLDILVLAYNQLSGGMENVSKINADVNIVYNNFSGDISAPIIGNNQLSSWNNHLTVGIVPTAQQTYYSQDQTLTGQPVTVYNGKYTFNPVTGAGIGFKFDTASTIDPSLKGTIASVNYSETAPVSQTDLASMDDAASDVAIKGDQLVANANTRDGYYTIVVKGPAGSHYSAYVTFQLTNDKTVKPVTPVDPVNPVDPTPGTTTGTVTIVNVDQDGKVISQHVQTGNVGDTYNVTADKIDGYQVAGSGVASGTYSANGSTVTFSYNQLANGGDGATIVTDNPIKDPKAPVATVTTGGAAAVVNKGGQSAATATAASVQKGAAAAKVNLAASPKSGEQPAKAAAKATLPQTGDKSVAGIVAAGLAVLVSGLGLAGFKNKRRN